MNRPTISFGYGRAVLFGFLPFVHRLSDFWRNLPDKCCRITAKTPVFGESTRHKQHLSGAQQVTAISYIFGVHPEFVQTPENGR